MVLIVDGNTKHVAHAGRKLCLFLEKKNTFVITLDIADQITEIAPYVRTYF